MQLKEILNVATNAPPVMPSYIHIQTHNPEVNDGSLTGMQPKLYLSRESKSRRKPREHAII